jgi:hypothetical protein
LDAAWADGVIVEAIRTAILTAAIVNFFNLELL